MYNDVDLTDPAGMNTYEYYNSGQIKKKEEFTGYTDNTWTATYWWRANGRLSQKLLATGEAAVYFDVDGWKLNTYWGTDGTVAHWATVADFDTQDNYKKKWYKNASNILEVYTYYATSGRVRYKNEYEWNSSLGTWVWQRASGWFDSGDFPFGDWDGEKTEQQTGASLYYTLPPDLERSDTGSASLVLEGARDFLKGKEKSMSQKEDSINEGGNALDPEVTARMELEQKLIQIFTSDVGYKFDPNLADESKQEELIKR